MMFVYSVLDRKAKEYGPPFLGKTVEYVRRGIVHGIMSGGPDSLMARYPEDYDVYCVGEFDTDTGVVVPMVPPRFEFLVVEVLQNARGADSLNEEV